jgi:SAM-dependent methyltransferase
MTQTSSNLPLAVWPCAHDVCCKQQILPALARRTIDTYSDPGDLVVDPRCASGTALVEAVRLDRDAIGVEADRTCADLAAANIEQARSDGAPGRARVLVGDGRDLPRVLARREARELVAPPGERIARLPFATAALVLTALPNARPAALSRYAASAAAVVKPGGFVVLVIDHKRAGTALAGELVQQLQQLGLLYWQHVIGLAAEIRGDELRYRGRPSRGAAITPCHEDVLVFRCPEAKR